MSDVIRDASLVRCPSCAGSGLVPRHTQYEIDCLRAENAELRETLLECTDGLASIHPAWGVVTKARAILAKTAKEGE